MESFTPKAVERQLGEQYAQALQENPQFMSVYKDAADVIHASLSVMEHYNRVALALQSMTLGKRSPKHQFSLANKLTS